MAGLSAAAYLLSKVLVLSVISVFQSLLIVARRPARRQDAVKRAR